MEESFLTFHSFPDEEVAADVAEKLREAGIDYRLIRVPKILDAQIIGVSSDPGYEIKLRREDFAKAHACLEKYYKDRLSTVDPGHYLFSFTNDELFEIIRKPDEWGYLDYQLAQQILADRGLPVDRSTLEDLKAKRKVMLAHPDKAGPASFFFAWLFIFNALLHIVSPVFFQSSLNFLSVIISILIGSYLFKNKRLLPDGESVYAYRYKDRMRGRFIMQVGVVVLLAALLKYLLFSDTGN